MKNELKDQLDPYFNQIKELIKSTAEATKTVLRNEIDDVKKGMKIMQDGLEDHMRQIVNTTKNEIRTEMHDMEARLKNKLASKEELKAVEINLSDKIDTIGVRLDEHEAKPAAIAHQQ